MDDDNTLDRSESTEGNEERSETETEGFDKPDSDIVSQNEVTQETRCVQCQLTFQNDDDFQNHNIQKHPILMYKCGVKNCLRWFSSRKSRDKHSENLNSKLHKSTSVKSPPVNAIFIEDASNNQLELLKCSSEFNRNKSKRGPKPKILSNDNVKDFLVGLPRDQLKRKLMESVVEKIESIPTRKYIQKKDSPILTRHSKWRPSAEQLSSVTIPNVSSPKQLLSKGNCNKNDESINNHTLAVPMQKSKPIPDFSYIKVPMLPIDNSFSIERFSEELINLLILYDPADYFKYPLVDTFAPLSAQLKEQIDMISIQGMLKKGRYSRHLENLQNDLLLLYSNGLYSFEENSIEWQEAAKLYQTTLVNIQTAKSKLSFTGNVFSNNEKSPILNDFKNHGDDRRSTFLNIMNPYNNGKISENERIMTIGEQLGKLKTGTQNLFGYKEDRRNKVTVLSYLDYGTNFSFAPSYDSGNAYCSKENSDLLIRAYGEVNNQEESQYEELNEIIPEFTLGDDFSLYLMNTFTRDIIKSFQVDELKVDDKIIPDIPESSDNTILLSGLQTLLNDSWKDLAQLKSINYQRLSNYQFQPSNDEQKLSEKVTTNLTNLILKTNPESVTNLNMIRKALNCT